jgi:two-component system, NtrC family, sensor kinase
MPKRIRTPADDQARNSARGEDLRHLYSRILSDATQGMPRMDFLKEVTKMLLDFSRLDRVQLRLTERGRFFLCEAREDAEPSVRVEALPCTQNEKNVFIPCTQEEPVLEQLCRKILSGDFDPSLPFFTPKGSFWTGDAEKALSALVKVDGAADEEGPFFGWEYRSLAMIPLAVGERNLGLLQFTDRRKDIFSEKELEFYEGIAQTVGVALAHRQVQMELRERIKELTCLIGIAHVASRPSVSLEEVFQDIVELLPPAWLYQNAAAARITLDERSYETPCFSKVKQMLSADIVLGEERRGLVEVGYTEEKGEQDEGPFLKEERNLIDAVAKEIALLLERRQAEEEKIRLQEQLRHADRLATIGQLAAGMAHELNEPLGSILGFAQLIKKDPGLPPQAKSDTDKIEAASLHAREVVRKLLIFARQVPTKKTLVSLNKVVEEGLTILSSRCAKEGIELVRDLAPDLPEITVDPAQLTQVLVNLVVNAIQAMPQGGRLTVRTGKEPGQVLLLVEDTGVGMSEEVKGKLYLPFFTTKEVGQGTGLGLPVVHGIVTAHSGTIRVDSEPGKGARFEVRLPVGSTAKR